MEDLKKELEKQKNYLILKDSEAGKTFLDNLRKEIDGKIAEIITTFRNISHIELITLVVELESLTTLLETIIQAEEKVETLKAEIEEEEKLLENK